MAAGLDNTVFTAPPARDYVGHALQIAKMFPDYGEEIRKAQAHQAQQQALQLKYQTDLQKAQQYLELYPEYRDAQIAQLRARAAQANAQAQFQPGLLQAHAELFRARAKQAGQTPDAAALSEINGGTLEAPPGYTAPGAVAAPAVAPAVAPEGAGVDVGNSWDIPY